MNHFRQTTSRHTTAFGHTLPVRPIMALRTILSVSATDHPAAAYGSDLREVSAELRYHSSLDTLALFVAPPGTKLEAAIVNIDSFLGKDTWLESLCRLRRARPDLPLIATSEQFTRNDFGTARLFMADVALVAPFDAAALFAALLQATENNLVWQNRQPAGPVRKEFVRRVARAD